MYIISWGRYVHEYRYRKVCHDCRDRKGGCRGVNISTEMDLMCHVIATHVRSSGFWWASCWSALPSRVRSAIPFGSRVTFFVKSFSIICWLNCAPGSSATFTPALAPPWGEGAFTVRLKSPDTSCVDQGSVENPWGINFPGLFTSWANCFSQKLFPPPTLASCPTYAFSCTCVDFLFFFFEGGGGERAHSHVSGGPPNQAWHHTRGLICYPTLISTLPATSTTPPSRWSGPDFGSNQSMLMVNSFQSCAKPIISHPEPTESQVKLAKAGRGEKNDKGHPQDGIIYHHRLGNLQQSTLFREILTT